MPDATLFLELVALFAVALAFGGAAGFSFVLAPTLLKRLPRAAAGEALRALFPVYYLAIAGTALAGMAVLSALAPRRNLDVALLAAVALVNIVQRRLLLPRMEDARARVPAQPMQDPGFRRLHAISVTLNLAAIALLLATLLRLGGP